MTPLADIYPFIPSLEDVCSITGEKPVDPVWLNHCHHIFDRIAIQEHIKTHVQGPNEASVDCPNCRWTYSASKYFALSNDKSQIIQLLFDEILAVPVVPKVIKEKLQESKDRSRFIKDLNKDLSKSADTILQQEKIIDNFKGQLSKSADEIEALKKKHATDISKLQENVDQVTSELNTEKEENRRLISEKDRAVDEKDRAVDEKEIAVNTMKDLAIKVQDNMDLQLSVIKSMYNKNQELNDSLLTRITTSLGIGAGTGVLITAAFFKIIASR